MYVLHVLPVDVARGAQIFAQALVDTAGRLSTGRHEIAVLFGGEQIALDADYRLVPTRGRARMLGLDPVAVQRLRALIRRVRPDLVVAHGGEALKYAALGFGSRPLIAHAIGVMSPEALHGPRGWLYRRLWARADLVVAVSTDVACQLHDKLGVAEAKLRVIPNGRDTHTDGPAQDDSLEEVPRLIFVGHMTGTKRPDLFLELVRRLRDRGRVFDAVMVGGGPLESLVKQHAGALDVSVLGERHDVAGLLQASSVFVFTSLAVNEGMPGVLIEAGLAGLPVVATDVPGARDVVLDGQTGRVVGADDVDALTDAVDELVQDPSLRRSLGAAGRSHCVARFDIVSSVEAWLRAIGELSPMEGLR